MTQMRKFTYEVLLRKTLIVVHLQLLDLTRRNVKKYEQAGTGQRAAMFLSCL